MLVNPTALVSGAEEGTSYSVPVSWFSHNITACHNQILHYWSTALCDHHVCHLSFIYL